MPASKSETPPVSAEGIGATDLARLDAHEVRPEEYEDLPELTDAMVAGAVPGDGADLARRGRGRPRLDSPKRPVTLRLDADVIEAMRASGPGWQVRANEALRERFRRHGGRTPVCVQAVRHRVAPSTRDVARQFRIPAQTMEPYGQAPLRVIRREPDATRRALAP